MEPHYADDLATIINGPSPAAIREAGDYDLVVTSPPYNLGNTTGGGIGPKSPSAQDFADGYAEHDDAMPHDEYIDWQQSVLRTLWDGLPDHGAIFYNVKARVQAGELMHPLDWRPRDLTLRQVIVWNRKTTMNYSPTFFAPSHELILLFAKPDWRLASKNQGFDVWDIPPGATHPSGRSHPCPFPDAIPERAIRASQTVTRVLDPFAGSGTTLAVAKSLGVPSVGIELSETYCELGAARLRSTFHEPSFEGMFN